MDRILIVLKKENGPRASSAPALGLNTIIFKYVYWHMKQISGERLQDDWSSGFDWLLGPHKGQNLKKKQHSKIFSSETVKWMNPVLCIHVPDSSLYIICVFYSSQIRTLVAMVTLSFHRLIMGKVEISYFLKTIAA